MAKRKAWADLASSTRARYERATKKSNLPIDYAPLIYSGRIIPSTQVYGKRPSRARMAEGDELTPKQTANIERLARAGGIKRDEIDDLLIDAINRGASYDDLYQILQQRAMIRKLPKKKRKEIGKLWYDNRRIELPRELYFY